MRVEKDKMTRKMKIHCGGFFKMSFFSNVTFFSLQVLLDQNAGVTGFYSRVLFR